jgi:hypothetical protein
MNKLAVAAIATLAFFSYAAPSNAQTRTWVSGVGDDLNPCSRTAPCKTFAGAISKTAAGGEIDCLDPGGFGTVTITKSITIDCTGTLGSILGAGTNGVNIPTAGIVVTLKGLTINGATTGLIGVNVTAGATVYLEDVIIQGFKSGTATGLLVKPNGGTAGHTSLNRVTLVNNTNGMTVDSTVSTVLVPASVRQSIATGNSGSGFTANSSATQITLMIDNSDAVQNGIGFNANGTVSNMIIGGNTVSTNGTGINITGSAKVFTYKTNNVNGNTTDVSGALQPVIPQT